ncbi:MAG TPA: hypothetical protein VKB57_20990 [Acidimicrobiales bacterium]|nr:hypothetical protein [Acidimicrobiales bacterium]
MAEGAHCTGCGRPAAECDGCGRASDPWHYCPACGRWLAVQVTPAGWTATCRTCATTHRGGHRT